MANNSKLYEKMWAIVNGPRENAPTEWEALAKSDNLDDNETCFLLAIQLRKLGRKEEAYKASKALSTYNPNLKSYNIYLASAYDLTIKKELSNEELNAVFTAALDYYFKAAYEVNLAATLLKCCNYLISEGLSDNTIFESIYRTIPEEDRNNNSFIISQYFKRLIAENLENEALEHYQHLLPELKGNKAILNIIKAIQREPVEVADSPKASCAEINRKITIISDEKNARKYSDLLKNFSLTAAAVDLFSDNIIENLNKATHKSTTAILIVTQEVERNLQFQNVFPFALGFCTHKFGRNGVKVFEHENAEIKGLNILNNFEVFHFTADVDFLTLLGQLKLIGA